MRIPSIRLKKNIAGVITLCMFMPMMPHRCSTLVGNKICLVSGQKIDEKTKVKYNYQGKTYNFCCTSCVDDFKKDPQKYIKKIEEEKLQEKSKQEEHASSESHLHSD